MAKIQMIHDIVEENGKTIKENNLAKKHDIPIGTLIEWSNGVRMYISGHSRDCDGTPLYCVSYVNDPWQWENNHCQFCGFGKDGLKIIT